MTSVTGFAPLSNTALDHPGWMQHYKQTGSALQAKFATFGPYWEHALSLSGPNAQLTPSTVDELRRSMAADWREKGVPLPNPAAVKIYKDLKQKLEAARVKREDTIDVEFKCDADVRRALDFALVFQDCSFEFAKASAGNHELTIRVPYQDLAHVRPHMQSGNALNAPWMT